MLLTIKCLLLFHQTLTNNLKSDSTGYLHFELGLYNKLGKLH